MTADHEPATSPARLRAALGAVIGLAVVWNVIGNLLLPGAWYVPANLLVAAITVAIAARAGLGFAELGLARADLGRGLRIGLIAALVVAVVIGIALLVPAAESALEDDDVARDPMSTRWYVPLVRIPLGTAVFEEVLFRSVLLGLLLCLRGRRAAIALTSVLFGLWHVVPAWETTDGSWGVVAASIVGTVVLTTLAGLAFALLRLHARSVLAPILAHVATNSFAYAAALIAIEVID